MKNSEYWLKRAQLLEDAQTKKNVEYFNGELERIYQKAIHDTEKDIASWYTRFASNNGISMVEAKKLLNNRELKEFKWTVEEYIKYGRENAVNGKWIKQLENASVRYHVSRLESLKLQMQNHVEVLMGNVVDDVTDLMREHLEDGYYRTAFEIQRFTGVGALFSQLDEDQIERILSKPWASDGINFSERIWGEHRPELVNELHKKLTQAIIMGKNPKVLTKGLAKYVSDEAAKSFRSKKSRAENLVMTETSFFRSEGQRRCYKELGVDEFENCATLDAKTSEICRDMDGTHFPVSDMQPGINCPPFHNRCRTATCPYFDDEFASDELRAARGADSSYYTVPADMTYREWERKFGKNAGLQNGAGRDIIKKRKEIKELHKLKQSGMTDDEYGEYLNIINGHTNDNIVRLYAGYADKIKKTSLKSSGGAYQSASVSLDFTYPQYSDMNKYGTLAHEYGHFFDDKAEFSNLHFEEMEAVKKATGLDVIFKNVASSSDEFLAALRKDKAHIKSIFTQEAKADLIAHNASNGVQDAIDGLFAKSRLCWGHGERYYNRRYATIEALDRVVKGSLKKKLQQVYIDLGLDASNQTKTKSICRQYEAASEAWANIMSAEVCGGESLEYVKKYLPNSYQALLDILKEVKINE